MTWFGVFDEDAAFVVFGDYAAGEGESESPAAFFCGEAGLEDLLVHFAFHAFAGVGDFYDYFLVFVEEAEGEVTFAVHCVNGVFAEVFEYPLDEWFADKCLGVSGVVLDFVYDFLRGAAFHVVDGVVEDCADVLEFEFRCAADF